MEWLQTFVRELGFTVSNGGVWRDIVIAVLFAGTCLAIGGWAARRVGLLPRDAAAGETVGVGLASGLVLVAVWSAAIGSGGRSAFTPVAIGMAVAIGLTFVRPTAAGVSGAAEVSPAGSTVGVGSSARGLALAVLLGAVCVAVIALLFGSTMGLSPRDGLQPLEFMDEAFYSILGADLAKTGIETAFSTAGFAQLPGLPDQTWYHWGEIWLTAGVIKALGVAPLAARTFVVLPVLLVAAGAMTGTLVRRFAGSSSTAPFAFGFVACLFLAPIPVIVEPFFGTWAVGTVFGITLYGMATLAVLLTMYSLKRLEGRLATPACIGFVGSTIAVVLPAHIAIGLLGLIGVAGVVAIRAARSLILTHRWPAVSSTWRRVTVWAGLLIVATVVWGVATGHGLGGLGSSPSVVAFNASWRDSIASTVLGAGAFLLIGVAWFMVRRADPLQAGLYVGTTGIVVTGALVWGLKLGDFNMFHVYFGAISVFGTPVAAIATWTVWGRMRTSDRHAVRLLSAVVIALVVIQIGLGTVVGTVRLQQFGPGEYAPVPIAILDAIRGLPSEAKVAYSCQPGEELAVWDPRLLSIGAHTDRRIVPMCFEADSVAKLVGGEPTLDVASPFFAVAPQRSLYPNRSARPSAPAVAAFLRDNGIDYIYEDAAHPNVLIPDASEIASIDGVRLLQVP